MNKFFTVAEAAREVNVPRWRLYHMISEGRGPRVVRWGRAIRITEAALAEWVAAQDQPAPTKP